MKCEHGFDDCAICHDPYGDIMKECKDISSSAQPDGSIAILVDLGILAAELDTKAQHHSLLRESERANDAAHIAAKLRRIIEKHCD